MLADVFADFEKIEDFLSDEDFLLSPLPKLKCDSLSVSEFRAVSPLPEEEFESFIVVLVVLDLLLRSWDLSVLLEIDADFVFGILLVAGGSLFEEL